MDNNSGGNGQDTNVVYLPRYDRAEPQTLSIPGTPPASTESPLSATLRLVRDESGNAALLVMCISKYREFVESFGEACGRRLDKEVNRRLQHCLRVSDRVLPLGGGEYGIVLPQPGEKEEVDRVCERLISNCGGNYRLAEVTPQINVAIGLALFPSDTRTAEDAERFARIALRRALASGGSDYHYFAHEMLNQQRYKLSMDGELERALAEDRFVLHYQPQYSLESNEIVGVEALVRMVSTSGQLVPPNDFIGIAEENDFIIDLGRWVIEEACRQMAEWRQAGCAPKRIAVNVSPRQLQDNSLTEVIDRSIHQSNLRYRDLELEVTENCMLEYPPATQEVFQRLRSKGVRIAIDDFGAGFSCFASLAQLPLDSFKLDRSFMTNICNDPQARRVVTAIIAMARELGYEIVAEGIETDQQYWLMQASGCHLVQGFGLARPQEAQAIGRLLESPGITVEVH